jgi:hypothetical protein
MGHRLLYLPGVESDIRDLPGRVAERVLTVSSGSQRVQDSVSLFMAKSTSEPAGSGIRRPPAPALSRHFSFPLHRRRGSR